jgi:hypothetical protein
METVVTVVLLARVGSVSCRNVALQPIEKPSCIFTHRQKNPLSSPFPKTLWKHWFMNRKEVLQEQNSLESIIILVQTTSHLFILFIHRTFILFTRSHCMKFTMHIVGPWFRHATGQRFDKNKCFCCHAVEFRFVEWHKNYSLYGSLFNYETSLCIYVNHMLRNYVCTL